MSDVERMNQLYGNLKVDKVRQAIWHERLLFFPIKLGMAFLAYYYLEHGLFLVIGYILFVLGEISARQYINAEEANLTFQDFHKNYAQGDIENFRDIEELRVRVMNLEISNAPIASE